MHFLHFMILAAKALSLSQSSQSRQSDDLSVNCILTDKPWYRTAVVYLSILNSRSYALVKLQGALNYKRGPTCFGLCFSLTSSHRSALRLLLIVAGDVEPNPGPVNYEQFLKLVLEETLRNLHVGEVGFVVPATKELIVDALRLEDQIAAHRALQSALGFGSPPSTSAAQAPPLVTGRIAKLPPFFEADTKAWFHQIEPLLQAECHTDHQRKISLLRVLDTNVLTQAGADPSWDFLAIRNSIMKHYDDTKEQKLKKFLADQTLGGRKPSTVLRQMQQMADGHDEIVKLRFLDILPTQVRVVCAGLPGLSLTQIADVADKMMEQMPSAGMTASIAASSFIPSPSGPSSVPIGTDTAQATIDALQQQNSLLHSQNSMLHSQMAELTKAVNAITTSDQRRSRYDKRDHSRSQSGPRFNRNRSSSRPFNPNGSLCFYHFQFGSDARKCKSPCSWGNRQSSPSGNGRTPAPARQASE